jgi:hypothetical protein
MWSQNEYNPPFNYIRNLNRSASPRSPYSIQQGEEEEEETWIMPTVYTTYFSFYRSATDSNSILHFYVATPESRNSTLMGNNKNLGKFGILNNK